MVTDKATKERLAFSKITVDLWDAIRNSSAGSYVRLDRILEWELALLVIVSSSPSVSSIAAKPSMRHLLLRYFRLPSKDPS